MHIRRQTAEVPLQRWSKSHALAETGATRLQHWEQEAHPALHLTSAYPFCYTCGAGLCPTTNLCQSCVHRKRGENTDHFDQSEEKLSARQQSKHPPLSSEPWAHTGASFRRRYCNIGANPGMASTPAAGFTVSLLCFIYFQTPTAFRRRNRKVCCFLFSFYFLSSFFFELALNSISTKRDKAVADTAADELNDGLDRVHPALV